MSDRLNELKNQLNALADETLKHPCLSYSDPLFEENREEWLRLNKEHEKYNDKFFKFYKKHAKEIDNLTIEENKKNHVYWENEGWIYDVVKTIPQHLELTGQERTSKFIESLNSIPGCIVSEDDAGYSLEIFTPYKVYLYRFNRGYGNYPIRISKGFIASGGNTYRNKIFLAKNTEDMKKRYFEN